MKERVGDTQFEKKRAKTCKNVQKRAKTCKNVQKCAKTCVSRTHASKNVHLKYSFLKKTCKNVQKRAKTCITSIFGPNSKTCIFKARAA